MQKDKVIEVLIEDAEGRCKRERSSVRQESIQVLKALMEPRTYVPDVMLTTEGNCVAWWKSGKHYLSATCLAKDKITSVLYTKNGYKAFTSSVDSFKKDVEATGFSSLVYGGVHEWPKPL